MIITKEIILFFLHQENYKQLNEALSESGHSWTALTLKLCTALDTADKLIQSANSDAKSLSEKVDVLQNIVRRGNSAVKQVKVINGAANIEKRSSAGC
ncbi:histone-lysine N-methyltransferase [Thalictrum thalictroides]|uniref:Histone-lysine N-methyltransferase n=1 Tax=Thalictrum thalictroides TaxID=46969 RepID=A0A7J6WT01_THATH|nr:histone-lysine N-methyltransferase [Thalictrum thalictroides]